MPKPYFSTEASSKRALKSAGLPEAATSRSPSATATVTPVTGAKMPAPSASVTKAQRPARRAAAASSATPAPATAKSLRTSAAGAGAATCAIYLFNELNSYFSKRSARTGLNAMSISMSEDRHSRGISVLIVTRALLSAMWPRASSNIACWRADSSPRCAYISSTLPYLEISLAAPTSPTPLTPGTLSEASPQMVSMSMTCEVSCIPYLAHTAAASSNSSSPPPLPGRSW